MGDSCTSRGSHPDMTSHLLELDIGKEVIFGKLGMSDGQPIKDWGS
jgi:hypothetical protein